LGALLNTAERLSSPPSCPPEQPQGFNSPSMCPVRKTVSAPPLSTDVAGGFVVLAVDMVNTHEATTVEMQMQITDCFMYKFDARLPAAKPRCSTGSGNQESS